MTKALFEVSIEARRIYPDGHAERGAVEEFEVLAMNSQDAHMEALAFFAARYKHRGSSECIARAGEAKIRRAAA